jgi:hypothetical protein
MHLEAGMSVRLSSLLKRSICLLALYISFLPLYSHAQALEGSGGYAHLTGNQGVDGFNVGVAAWFTDRVALAADYDSAWDTSQIGVFQITPTGLVVSKSHLQNFLVGPRVSFPGLIKKKSNDKRIARLEPFAEVQFGVSHLNTSLNAPIESSWTVQDSGPGGGLVFVRHQTFKSLGRLRRPTAGSTDVPHWSSLSLFNILAARGRTTGNIP